MHSPHLATAWQLFNQGRFLEAERAAGLAGGDPQALLLLGVIHSRSGRLDSAITYLQRAHQLAPSQFESVNWLSFTHFQKGNFEEAEQCARRALKLQPSDSDALNNLGLALYGQWKLQEAVAAYEASIKVNPRFPTTYRNLASSLVALRDYAKAKRTLSECVRLGGDGEPARVLYAEAAMGLNDYESAIENARKALEFNLSSSNAYTKLGTALWLAGDASAAEALEQATKLDPGNAEAHSNLGSAYISLGNMDKAATALRKSIALKPLQGTAYYYLITQTASSDLSDVLDGALVAYHDENLSLADQSMLCYALARDCERRNDYKKAMAYYDQARDIDHHLFNRGTPFNRDSYRKTIDAIIARYDWPSISGRSIPEEAPFQPIFIVGMIRSGTTLLDQILSSHPAVRSAGELGFFFTSEELDGAVLLEEISPKRLQEERARQISRMSQAGVGAQFITDKMPANTLVLGNILAAFPQAKIIHVRRHPVDTCLSIWTTANRTPPSFAQSKEGLVFAYREQMRLMKHWRAVIPRESMLEITYEDLVQDREPVLRQVAEFCGLEWNDALLHHEQNPNSIATPSLWQARQPIYRSSMGRWKRFEPHLGALVQLA